MIEKVRAIILKESGMRLSLKDASKIAALNGLIPYSPYISDAAQGNRQDQVVWGTACPTENYANGRLICEPSGN